MKIRGKTMLVALSVPVFFFAAGCGPAGNNTTNAVGNAIGNATNMMGNATGNMMNDTGNTMGDMGNNTTNNS